MDNEVFKGSPLDESKPKCPLVKDSARESQCVCGRQMCGWWIGDYQSGKCAMVLIALSLDNIADLVDRQYK